MTRHTLRISPMGNVTLGQKGTRIARIWKPYHIQCETYVLCVRDPIQRNKYHKEWSGTALECLAYLNGRVKNDPRVVRIDANPFLRQIGEI